jgi:hypothetical protein
MLCAYSFGVSLAVPDKDVLWSVVGGPSATAVAPAILMKVLSAARVSGSVTATVTKVMPAYAEVGVPCEVSNTCYPSEPNLV